jgi:hypothetical protein
MRLVWIFSNALAVVTTLVSRDGHDVGLIVGASLAAALPLTRMVFSNTEMNTFAEPPIGERQMAH